MALSTAVYGIFESADRRSYDSDGLYFTDVKVDASPGTFFEFGNFLERLDCEIFEVEIALFEQFADCFFFRLSTT